MSAYSNRLSAEDVAADWKYLKDFKLDVQGAAQTFQFIYGQDDGHHQWNAEDGKKPYSYDSESNVWREFTSMEGWEVVPSVLPQLTEIMAILCAHAAVEKADRGTKPEERPDPADYNIDPDTGESRTVSQQQIKRKFDDKQAAKIDEQYRKLRQQHLGSNVGKAALLAQPMMAVDRWNVNDDLIGLPGCQALYLIQNPPATSVREDRQEPAQYITRTMASKPGTASKLWEQFVLDVCDGDAEMVSGLQLWTAASLLKGNPEHKTHLLFGDGAVGKSTFLRVVQTAMGDYAGTARASLFTSEKDSHPAELLVFTTKRMVILPELPRGALRSDILKTVSGGDAISVREMRANPRTEIPTATLWFSCNELPGIRMVDEAIKRRLLVWPFEKKPATIDVQLGQKLVGPAHLGGVVTWLVEGQDRVLSLRAKGTPLPLPVKVIKATEEYFDEVDLYAAWAEECLAETGETASKELFVSYKAYSEKNDRKASGERSLYLWLGRHYDKRRTKKGSIYPVMVK